MEQKSGLRSLYDEFFRDYGADFSLICLELLSNSTYN